MEVIGEYMKTLTISEVGEVSGGGKVSDGVVTIGVTAGSAQIGAFLAGARLGGTFGAAAGPMGAVIGAMVGGGVTIAYLRYKN
jgi:hypothetical protein